MRGSEPGRGVASGAWLVAAALFAVVAFALHLWSEPLDHGYSRYATIALEMVRSGDWIAPRLDGRLYVDKPPLAIWSIALAMALTNSTASLTHHAPNFVGLLLSVLFLRRLGARVFGRADAGWLVVGLYLCTLLPFSLLRDKRIDPLFTACLIGAFDFAHAALAAQPASRARLRNWIGAAVLLAAGTLTKGPLAFAFVAPVVLVYAAWTRQLRTLASRDVRVALALWLVLSLLWPLAMLYDVGWCAWSERLSERDFVTRFAGPLHYFAKLPLRLAPWTLLLPALALALTSLLRGPSAAALRFPVTWFGVVFVILHITSAKHSRYLLPAFPGALLILLALWIEPATGAVRALGPRTRQLRDGALALVLGIGVLVGAAAPFVPIWMPEARSVWPGLAIGAVIAVVIGVAGLRGLRAGGSATFALARAIALILVLEGGFDLLRAGGFLAKDDLAKAQLALADVTDGAPTLLLQLRGGSRNVVQLATRRTLASASSSEDARNFATLHGDAFVVAPLEAIAPLRDQPGIAVGVPVPLRLAGRSLVVARLQAVARAQPDDAPADTVTP